MVFAPLSPVAPPNDAGEGGKRTASSGAQRFYMTRSRKGVAQLPAKVEPTHRQGALIFASWSLTT